MPTHRHAIYLTATLIAAATPSFAQTLICQQLPDGAIYCPRPTPPQMVVVQQPAPVIVQQPYTQPRVVRHTAPPAPYVHDPAILDPLPDTNLPPDASPREYLRAARRAIDDRNEGVAEEALNMALSRILTRSVDAGRTDEPSDMPITRIVGTAIKELQVGHWVESDRLAFRALQVIERYHDERYG